MNAAWREDPALRDVLAAAETCWINPQMKPFAAVADGRLYDDLRALHAAEKLFIEPSACAAFAGYRSLARFPAAQSYLKAHGLIGKLENASHILWATGGRLVPALTRKEYLAKRL